MRQGKLRQFAIRQSASATPIWRSSEEAIDEMTHGRLGFVYLDFRPAVTVARASRGAAICPRHPRGPVQYWKYRKLSDSPELSVIATSMSARAIETVHQGTRTTAVSKGVLRQSQWAMTSNSMTTNAMTRSASESRKSGDIRAVLNIAERIRSDC